MTHTKPTQTARVLAALREGPLTPIDTLDWRPPIMRLAARVKELRNAGHAISTGKAGKVAKYTLEAK